jgi:two-component system phosphate regulon sensor histidine kinase PhoR
LRRVRTLQILTTACASSGLACCLIAASIGGATGQAIQWLAPALFALAVTAACAACYRLRLSCKDLAGQLGANPSPPPAAMAAVARSVANSDPAMALHDMTREKEISDMKNDFVSMVSHELRTPLASIKAYIEMLIDGEAVDQKTTSEFYDVIQNEANRLGRLIDNILNISRIESGLVKADHRPQSLTVIVKEALEVIAPQAAQKGIRLVEDLAPVSCQTKGDREMLYQAVLNLLSNSVKYTPPAGTVTVRTTVDQACGKVVLRIIDTGVGIPQQDLPFVFEKFCRAEANSGISQGTGLGLSLVRQIIEGLHQGRVFVESNVGKGSTFGFELKLSES